MILGWRMRGQTTPFCRATRAHAPHHRNAKTESHTSPHVWSAVPCISDICFSIPARRASASCCRVSRTRPTPATIGALEVAADVRSKLPYCSMLSLIYCHREDALVDVVGVMLPVDALRRQGKKKSFLSSEILHELAKSTIKMAPDTCHHHSRSGPALSSFFHSLTWCSCSRRCRNFRWIWTSLGCSGLRNRLRSRVHKGELQ